MTGKEDPPLSELGETTSEHVPAWLGRFFETTWSWVTKSKLGLTVFVALIYVIPYGLGLLAVGSQVRAGGDFAVLAFAALVASTFASAQPAPTPAMGTLSLVLVGFMGAYFDPLVVGVVAGTVATIGLVTSYGVGATGVGRLLFARMGHRPAVANTIERAFDVTRRYGPWAILLFAFIPNPLYAWSSVAGGASKTKFGSYLAAAATGSFARFVLVAFLGKGIEQILN